MLYLSNVFPSSLIRINFGVFVAPMRSVLISDGRWLTDRQPTIFWTPHLANYQSSISQTAPFTNYRFFSSWTQDIPPNESKQQTAHSGITGMSPSTADI